MLWRQRHMLFGIFDSAFKFFTTFFMLPTYCAGGSSMQNQGCSVNQRSVNRSIHPQLIDRSTGCRLTIFCCWRAFFGISGRQNANSKWIFPRHISNMRFNYWERIARCQNKWARCTRWSLFAHRQCPIYPIAHKLTFCLKVLLADVSQRTMARYKKRKPRQMLG